MKRYFSNKWSHLTFAAMMLFSGIATNATAQEQADTATWAVPVVSVTNIRVGGDYDKELETQALLGMPLRVVKNDHWLHVQTPDNDKGYVLNTSVKKMTDAEMKAWNSAPQVVVTALNGYVYEKPDLKSQHVSDVVAANRLKLLGTKKKFYQVEYPDGRKGYLPTAIAMPLEQWQQNVKHDAQSIIATAMTLNGTSYWWGGTSTKGVDCSGLVRTTLLMHDITLPRNASQQAKIGEYIDIAPDFSNLIPGDLVFFGRKATDEKPAHVSHVGIYIGNQKFIHSLAWVHVSSFNPADPEYDEYDLNRLLWARRILPFINKIPELNTSAHNAYYNCK